jgi:hypothetical protein
LKNACLLFERQAYFLYGEICARDMEGLVLFARFLNLMKGFEQKNRNEVKPVPTLVELASS